MRKISSILFIFLMLLQAIPVLHFFAEQKEIFYSYVDEEEPHKSKVEKKAAKEFLSITLLTDGDTDTNRKYRHFKEDQPLSPSLDFLAPPPNAC